MRVEIDDQRCQGHAVCNMIDPETFFLRDEDGRAYLLSDVVPDGSSELVRRAARNCPEEAIKVQEVPVTAHTYQLNDT